jgi:hypothetical protein
MSILAMTANAAKFSVRQQVLNGVDQNQDR